MENQRNKIVEALQSKGWHVINTEVPESNHYWWVKEFWNLKKGDKKLVLSFLCDPQERDKRNIWAVTGSKEEPTERVSAESNPKLVLNKNWEDRLEDWMKEIEN